MLSPTSPSVSANMPFAFHSFGDPNAQPPTPKQTPTSTVFPSPIFETPKNIPVTSEESSGWTPRFAEEYSVFNATPGNLRGSNSPFVDFGSFPPSTGVKRPLPTAEGLAAEIAAHVNHYSPNPDLPLPPVDPSRRLPSSPDPLSIPREYYSGDSDTESNHPTSIEGRSAKKLKKGSGAVKESVTQTATPPPSVRKGERKLAPKAKTDKMQNDQGYCQPDFTGTPQQPNMATFVTTPSDMFGFPLSAPATAPANFWDPSGGISGMDLDFTGAGPNVFQTPTPSHRPMGSFDWGNDAQLFQDPSALPPSNQENNGLPAKRERPLAPKTMMSNAEAVVPSSSMMPTTYTTTVEDPFGLMSPSGAVDPGLLFSRPPSSSMDMANFAVDQPIVSQVLPRANTMQAATNGPARHDIRRSVSVREPGNRQPERATVSSPIKASGRPGLQRSFSENRGKRGNVRSTSSTLPTLAPAVRSTAQAPSSGSGIGGSRSVSSRPSGRVSPIKSHLRIPSLTAIPESSGPRTRTSVKFTIDSKGRARAETTVVVDEPSPTTGIHKRRISKELPQRERSWGSSDDESSTDDEPIIIPSRNTSFALPDPRKPLSSFFHASQRSISENSTSTYASFTADINGQSHNDIESEAETVMNDHPSNKGGDAASELRKVVENRLKQGGKRPSSQTSRRFRPGNVGQYQANAVSPTTLTDASLPTPSTDSRSHTIRCVCNRNDDGEGFMIQW
jgi:hypothetical protein